MDASYVISIEATSDHFSSLPVDITVLGIFQAITHSSHVHFALLVTAVPSVAVMSMTTTSISLSWSVPSGTVVSSYEVKWQALSGIS